jgi:hypothetical protein
LLLLGTLFLYRGREQIVSVNMMLPQTVATLRENLRWIRKQGSCTKKSRQHARLWKRRSS